MRLSLNAILPRHHRAKTARKAVRREMTIYPRTARRCRQPVGQGQLIQSVHEFQRARLKRGCTVADMRARHFDELLEREIVAVIALELQVIGFAVQAHEREELRVDHSDPELSARREVRFAHEHL